MSTSSVAWFCTMSVKCCCTKTYLVLLLCDFGQIKVVAIDLVVYVRSMPKRAWYFDQSIAKKENYAIWFCVFKHHLFRHLPRRNRPHVFAAVIPINFKLAKLSWYWVEMPT